MTARHYTRCVKEADYIGKVAAQAIYAAALVAIPVAALGGALVPGVGATVLAAIIAYCRWWLYDRLICLGGEECAVGWVSKIEPPSKKSLLDRFDTDYSFNFVLAPLVTPTQNEAQADAAQGKLVTNHTGLEFQGMQETTYGNIRAAALHAEFEGGGVYDLMMACLAALPFAVAATVVCAIPLIGWVACAILGIIAALIFLVGLIAANDVNSSLGELHTNEPGGRGADIVVVRGTWVYDSAHEGWNELHPITHCQRIDTWGGNWWGTPFEPPYTQDAVNRWCREISYATSDTTVQAQSRAENQWTIHPAIDGCRGDSEQASPSMK
jgi:hypothetical protein